MRALSLLVLASLALSACSSPNATGTDSAIDAAAARDAAGIDAASPSDASHGVGDGGAVRHCASAGECYGSTPACDVRSGRCVACRTDADCGTLFCDPASGAAAGAPQAISTHARTTIPRARIPQSLPWMASRRTACV